MTLGVRPPGILSRIDSAIAPGFALLVSLFVAKMDARYTEWYGDDMPPLTSAFFAHYPLYIAITAGGVVLQVLGKMIPKSGPLRTLWKMIDTLVALASVLIIVVGMIALSLPLFLLQLPI